jgi:chromosome segregation ATPase
MSVRLKKLMLTNFKGIKSLTLDLDGKDASIYGDNATGKTTVYDAFLWLLFDKDSQNRADFNIKTLDAGGEPLHGLDHEVEAVLDIDGDELVLKKSYKEKWVKRRGRAVEEFDGHTTDYFIDGVSSKKKEYDAKIAEIADEDAFKLLTSSAYFNKEMHWQERRELLLEVCGDISDEDVIASDKALKDLPSVLGKRSVEGHRKVITAKRKEINRELERIPVRIDEATRGLPDISSISAEALPGDIAKVQAGIKARNEEIAQAEAGGGAAEKTKQLREVEAEILKLQNERNQKRQAEINEKQAEADQVKREITEAESSLERIGRVQNERTLQISQLEKEMKALRDEWHSVNRMESGQGDTCPTCGQALPEDQIEGAIASFNRRKAENLAIITADGKERAEQVGKLKAEFEENRKRGVQMQAELKKLQGAHEALTNEIKAIKEAPSPETPEMLKLVEKKESLEAEIELIKAGRSDSVDKLRDDLAGLEQILAALQEEGQNLKTHAEGQKRIEELKDEERRLAAEYERLEKELYICEQFIRAKVGLLEDKINSKFKMARFKLFNILINGAVEECCETVYKGVPYQDMNNAAKINTGLDIIRTLSKHYKFAPPIFIDNAEAVVQLLPMEAQMIRLVVSAKDKTLRVETEGK